MKRIEINLYTFAELSETAKGIAINEALNYLNSISVVYEDESGEMKSEYFDHTEEEAEDFIKVNGYFFFSNGEQAHVIEYTGKHPRAGESELNLFGEIYKF